MVDNKENMLDTDIESKVSPHKSRARTNLRNSIRGQFVTRKYDGSSSAENGVQVDGVPDDIYLRYVHPEEVAGLEAKDYQVIDPPNPNQKTILLDKLDGQPRHGVLMGIPKEWRDQHREAEVYNKIKERTKLVNENKVVFDGDVPRVVGNRDTKINSGLYGEMKVTGSEE